MEVMEKKSSPAKTIPDRLLSVSATQAIYRCRVTLYRVSDEE